MADVKLERLLSEFKKGNIDGVCLSDLVKKGEITKQERRKIQKLASKKLSGRQLLRREVNEKKKLPKISQEERDKRYRQTIAEERELKNAQYETCLGCRKKGHLLKYCPEAKNVNICFNCGSNDHPLRKCPHPSDIRNLPHAVCFLCKKEGHITRNCPENPNGLYPKGGCCHICQQKTHLAKDCPDKPSEQELKAKREREEDLDLGPRIGQIAVDPMQGDDAFEIDPVSTATNDDDADSDEPDTVIKPKKKKLKKSRT